MRAFAFSAATPYPTLDLPFLPPYPPTELVVVSLRYHTKRAPLTSEYTSLGHIKRRRTAIYDPDYWKVLKAQVAFPPSQPSAGRGVRVSRV